jgi:hypothetical protein
MMDGDHSVHDFIASTMVQVITGFEGLRESTSSAATNAISKRSARRARKGVHLAISTELDAKDNPAAVTMPGS